MERAEKLKEYLSEEKTKGNKKTAIGSNGKDTKSGGGKSKYVGTKYNAPLCFLVLRTSLASPVWYCMCFIT